MAPHSTRRLQDGLVASASVGIVFGGMALLDETVRRFLTRLTHGDFALATQAIPDVRVRDVMRSATDLVGRDHVEIAAFALVGGILFLLMFKT